MPADDQTKFNPSLMNWDDLRYFLTLADSGTLSAAAREVKVTHATMSRRITQLEESLGTQLFHRSLTGMELTEPGQKILDQVRLIMGHVAAVQDLTAEAETGECVRISVPPFLSEVIVEYCLREVLEKFPGMEIEVVSEKRIAAVSKHEADLTVRLGTADPDADQEHHLGSVTYGLFRAKGRWPKLTGARFVGYTRELSHILEASWIDDIADPGLIKFRSNTLHNMRLAIEQGMGIGILPVFLAKGRTALEQIEPVRFTWEREIWLTMRSAQKDLPRIQLLAQHLRKGIETATRS